MIYQITFIVKDEKDKDIVAKTAQSFGGTIVDERIIGTRKLVYPIKKLTEAVYITYHIDIAPAEITKLEQKLNFEEKVIRFLIIRTEKIIKPYVAPVVAPEQIVLPVKPEKPELDLVAKPVEPAKTVVVQKPKKKVVVSKQDEAKRLKALDEKLQELLKE